MAGYSRNDLGEIGTDGVLRDLNGNEVQRGVDEDTKAQMQEMLDGPKVRVLPSEHDIYKAAASGAAVVGQGEKYVYPNQSEDHAAVAFRPGYDVKDANSSGEPDSVVAEPSTPELPSEKATKERLAKESAGTKKASANSAKETEK